MWLWRPVNYREESISILPHKSNSQSERYILRRATIQDMMVEVLEKLANEQQLENAAFFNSITDILVRGELFSFLAAIGHVSTTIFVESLPIVYFLHAGGLLGWLSTASNNTVHFHLYLPRNNLNIFFNCDPTFVVLCSIRFL